MSLLSDADRQVLLQRFSTLSRPVRLVFFTQTFGCDTCDDAKRILDELAGLSDKVSVETLNLVLDTEKAAQFGVDRAPTTVVVAVNDDGTEQDYGIRFVGLTAGYEFSSLVEAIELVSSGESHLSDANRAVLATLARPVRIQVFVTPT